ncbi:hypothetical protein ACG2LH_17270 [Zhouia sp. PK063]|uniref:hypothetical protein n=1 Tax=Zhouia sp. PK063 TaxID=3373602 RepID=UPI0037B24A19
MKKSFIYQGKPMLSKFYKPLVLILITILTMSCNSKRRIYISNKTDKPITLLIDNSFAPTAGSIAEQFKDSLHNKSINSGNLKIYFGYGTWNASEERSLTEVLKNLQIKKEGEAKSFKLPNNLTVGHGIFIPELIVKIEEPKD